VALLSFGAYLGLKPKAVATPLLKAKRPDRPPAAAAARLSAVQQAASSLKLQAILYKGPKSSLIINGRTLHVGDEVEGARIVTAEPQSITIEKAGEELVVYLPAL
jgi:hypothetical protein